MVNQICIAGLQGLSEALDFGQNAGLDMNKVLGVVSMVQPSMADGKPGFYYG